MAIHLIGGYQTDFARAWSREGLDYTDMMREAIDGALDKWLQGAETAIGGGRQQSAEQTRHHRVVERSESPDHQLKQVEGPHEHERCQASNERARDRHAHVQSVVAQHGQSQGGEADQRRRGHAEKQGARDLPAEVLRDSR